MRENETPKTWRFCVGHLLIDVSNISEIPRVGKDSCKSIIQHGPISVRPNNRNTLGRPRYQVPGDHPPTPFASSQLKYHILPPSILQLHFWRILFWTGWPFHICCHIPRNWNVWKPPPIAITCFLQWAYANVSHALGLIAKDDVLPPGTSKQNHHGGGREGWRCMNHKVQVHWPPENIWKKKAHLVGWFRLRLSHLRLLCVSFIGTSRSSKSRCSMRRTRQRSPTHCAWLPRIEFAIRDTVKIHRNHRNLRSNNAVDDHQALVLQTMRLVNMLQSGKHQLTWIAWIQVCISKLLTTFCPARPYRFQDANFGITQKPVMQMGCAGQATQKSLAIAFLATADKVSGWVFVFLVLQELRWA